MVLGPASWEVQGGCDRWFKGSQYDKKGKKTFVDVYPRYNVPMTMADQEVGTMVQHCRDVLSTVREGGFHASDAELVRYGRATSNPTKGRQSPDEPIEDREVLYILGGLPHPDLKARVRGYLTHHFQLPEHGTGLSTLYSALEYRLERGATVEHKSSAREAIALIRSLDKVACADWAEQPKAKVREWAWRVPDVELAPLLLPA